jgi:sulfide dehydrogenase cytochrome subunit
MRLSMITFVAAALALAAAPLAAAEPPRLETLPAASGEALAHTCAACHGTQGRLGDEAFMPLAGMPPAQFVRSMQDFRAGRRPATLMGYVARGFTDADLRAMADYFARQTPAEGSAAAMVAPAKPINQGANR